jgi:mRNA-degrading endonuclease RelE of RelBE toxin-antitoxin system
MKIELITTPEFEKEFKRLNKKYASLKADLKVFEKDINENPKIGDPLGEEVYKVRIAIKSKNKGKSGGGRIITFAFYITISERKILLVTLYDKGEKDSISDAEIKSLIKKWLLLNPGITTNFLK